METDDDPAGWARRSSRTRRVMKQGMIFSACYSVGTFALALGCVADRANILTSAQGQRLMMRLLGWRVDDDYLVNLFGMSLLGLIFLGLFWAGLRWLRSVEPK
jgi:hypothetical protein